MASNASDPKDLKLVLNPARRKALLALVGGIVSHMRSKIEQSFEASISDQLAPIFRDPEQTPSTASPSGGREWERGRIDPRDGRSPSNPRMRFLKEDALAYFDRWSREVRNMMRNVCEGPEDPRSEQRRREWNAARNPPPPIYNIALSNPKSPEAIEEAEAEELKEAREVSSLQAMYYPIQTRLTTISKQDRICVISCMVLALLGLGNYSAHSRVLLCHLTSSLAVPMSILTTEETEIAKTLMLASKALSADEETQKRQNENVVSRRWKVGLASVAGAAVIGITGGLAAPVVAGAIGGIMSGVGLGGLASFLGIFAMNGALVGTLFGAFGGKMTGEMVDAYAKEVSDFKFLPVAEELIGNVAGKESAAATEARRLRITIGVNGWLNDEDDVIKPWKVMGEGTEVFALRYEMDALLGLGTSLKGMVSSTAWSYVKLEILKRTVLATLWSALWPVYLLKMATSVDNPFSVARNRSEKAGEVLADALINKAQGERPVTLIGYSLGSRLIYSCLRSLAERKAFGLIEDVILIGSPIPSSKADWTVMRSVVSGKFMNVYSENDYILAFLYRATSIQFGVAGLQKIEGVEGIENLDLSSEVSGHLRYPELIGKILKKCGVEGINVEDAGIDPDLPQAQMDLIDFEIDGHKSDLDAKSLSNAGILDLVDLQIDGYKSDLGAKKLNSAGILDLLNDEPTFPVSSSLPSSSRDQPPPHQERRIEERKVEERRVEERRVEERRVEERRVEERRVEERRIENVFPTTFAGPPLVSERRQPETQAAHGPASGHSGTNIRDLRDDSDDDEGGIQMIDNDSDGELQMLSGDPIPNDELVDFSSGVEDHAASKNEQKSLGHFPTDQARRTRASDMGLY